MTEYDYLIVDSEEDVYGRCRTRRTAAGWVAIMERRYDGKEFQILPEEK